jgi:VanZ family protein
VLKSRWGRFALGWAVLILVLCLLPRTSVPETGFLGLIHFDKLVHAILFGGLQAMLLKARYEWRSGLRSIFVMGAMVVIYGGSIELLQEMMDLGRRGSLADLAADVAGVILATVLIHRAEARRSVPYNV